MHYLILPSLLFANSNSFIKIWRKRIKCCKKLNTYKALSELLYSTVIVNLSSRLLYIKLSSCYTSTPLNVVLYNANSTCTRVPHGSKQKMCENVSSRSITLYKPHICTKCNLWTSWSLCKAWPSMTQVNLFLGDLNGSLDIHWWTQDPRYGEVKG